MAGRSWFDIRVQTEVENRNAVRSKIMGWPEHVAQTMYWPALDQIGKDGAEFMRGIIVAEDRIDTWKMHNSVRSRPRQRAKDAYSLFVGWIDGKPGYAIFQEHGTRAGVVAMNSVSQTQEYMLSRIKQLASLRGRTEAGNTSFEDN